MLLNPLPIIQHTTPETVTSAASSIVVQGSGFVPTSVITVNGAPIPTIYTDSSKLAGTVNLQDEGTTQLTLLVSNPGPGSATSDPDYLPVRLAPFTVSPAILPIGSFTLTISRTQGFPADAQITLDGNALPITVRTASTITATAFNEPWKTGFAALAVGASGGTKTLSVPVRSPITAYDAAQRLAMQAAFGPRADVIDSIQQNGMKAWIALQMAQPADSYDPNQGSRWQFMHFVLSGQAVLRQRTAWAFQTFLPELGLDPYVIPWEMTLEAHAFGNYKQIMLDAMSMPSVPAFLNLPGNNASNDPSVHPNQNFAREFLQLFTLGTTLLNEDGTAQLDSAGNPLSVYDQNTIDDLSRALTGWNYPPPINNIYTWSGIDWSEPLSPVEAYHDMGAKLLFGSVVLAAGQTGTQDRDQVIETVFQHPNLPPFICRLLIQRFTKSQPSPAYVYRMVQVFKNNGHGVRGDLSAVITAILLDPEARSGDTTDSPSDGFVQDPLYTLLSVMHLLQLQWFDGQPTFIPGQLGEDFWETPSIFGYFSPSYIIPGTTINSPEFQLIDNVKLVERSQLIWSAVTANQLGSPLGNVPSSIYKNYPTLPAILDALNHMVFHGSMPAGLRSTIESYCSSISDQQMQLQTAVFLALNSDNNTAVH